MYFWQNGMCLERGISTYTEMIEAVNIFICIFFFFFCRCRVLSHQGTSHQAQLCSEQMQPKQHNKVEEVMEKKDTPTNFKNKNNPNLYYLVSAGLFVTTKA